MSAQESEVLISTSHTSLLLSTSQGGELKFLYYGRKLTDADVHAIVSTESGSFSAYPVYGLNCPSESALSVQHEDGNMTLQMGSHWRGNYSSGKSKFNSYISKRQSISFLCKTLL